MSTELFLLILLEVILLAALGLLLFFSLFQFYAAKRGAPYVASRSDVMDRMIRVAHIRAGRRVLELGSGNGELCIRTAQQGGIAMGIELNPLLCFWSRLRSWWRGTSQTTSFLRANFFNLTLPRETEVVFLYLLPKTMTRLWPKLTQELKPGTLIISNAFEVRGVQAEASCEGIHSYCLPPLASHEAHF